MLEQNSPDDRHRGPTPEQIYHAALAVCSRARSRDDAEGLLDALGLLDADLLRGARQQGRVQ